VLILQLLQCIIAIPTGIKVFSLVSYSLVVILISVAGLFFRFYYFIYSQAVPGIILANGIDVSLMILIMLLHIHYVLP